MPELPEVETTVRGLNRTVKGQTITDVWTDYYSEFHLGKPNIKDRAYFKKFRTAVRGKKILHAARRAKNVLINLSGGLTILVHMKMTGHLLYGTYKHTHTSWVAQGPGPLRDDPFNRFIRVVFSLNNGRHLALSDLRRFAKVTLIRTSDMDSSSDLRGVGPEPLEPRFSLERFRERLLAKPNGRVKQVLMDQTVLAGIGNIYSDEILWRAGVHPLSRVKKIPEVKLRRMFGAMKEVLRHSLRIGGDSESDYRDVLGRPGGFQKVTKAYAREGAHCEKLGCGGTIARLKIGGRSAHFCDKHQYKYN